MISVIFAVHMRIMLSILQKENRAREEKKHVTTLEIDNHCNEFCIYLFIILVNGTGP